MASPRTRTAVSAGLLILIAIAAACLELDLAGRIIVIPAIALPLFFALEWSRLAWVARLLILIALAAALVFWQYGDLSAELVSAAVQRAAFFTFFVVSLDILRAAAQTSRLIQQSGKLIINQPPGRRYTVLTLGGHLFGILLNMGSINLLGTMIRRSVDTGQEGVEERIREIRLRRMTLAMFRGFATVPMWAPTSVAMAIVLVALEGLTWFDLAPIGFSLAMSFVAFGWILDRVSFPRPPQRQRPQNVLRMLFDLAPLLLINVLILGPTFAVAQVLSLRLIGAMLISVPFIGVGWMIFQNLRAGRSAAVRLTARRLRRHVLPGLVTLRSEVGILAASGFLAVVLLPQINVDALSRVISEYGLGGGWVLVLSLWTICLLAPTGINPIITVSLAIGILAELPGLNIPTYLIALTAIASWSIVTGFSPVAAANRLISRCVQKSPFEVGILWNGIYCLCLLVGVSILLLALA